MHISLSVRHQSITKSLAMKTTNPSLPLLPIIFLLSALANTLLLDASAASFRNPAVLDTQGDVVMAGQTYFILSTAWGALGGGVSVACTNKTGTTCPLDIVHVRPEFNYGLPFSFYPVNVAWARFVVQESTDLNILSPGVNICGIENSTMWGLEYDQSKRKTFVKTCAPAEGNPGCTNWFKFEKVTDTGSTRNVYKIVFCPRACDNFNVVCKDIGIYYDGNSIRLALSNGPFRVVLRKACGIVPTITTVSTM